MPSFGETLKRERELRQISLREISEATKINLRYLDALEKNEFRHLPGGVFNKGFVRAFAQYIGIDPEAMVESYLEELRAQEARTQDKERERGRRPGGEPRRATAAAEGPRSRRGLWIAAGVILLIAAAAFATWGISALRRHRGEARPSPQQGDAIGASGASTEPQQTPPASPATAAPSTAAAGEEGLAARILVARSVKGSITCDGRVVHALESLPEGALVDVRCREALVLDADDAGAIRVGIDGADPVRLGADGTPLKNYRVEAARKPEPAGGTP
jgi:cytoskeletal protein RodZ